MPKVKQLKARINLQADKQFCESLSAESVTTSLGSHSCFFLGAIPSVTLNEKDYVSGTQPGGPTTVTLAPVTVLFKQSRTNFTRGPAHTSLMV